ncbi:MAG: RSP_2648 family PIN domain-containing protein [Planktomarina sp.]
MRLVIDACVLYPSIMRSVLLAVAGTGAFEPIWSPRLLEEWRRAAARRGAVEGAAAETEIVLMKTNWPQALRPDVAETARYWLPDENDIHVLAVAVASSSDGIVTVNKKDFPGNILNEYDLIRHDPDALLVACFGRNPDDVRDAVQTVIDRALTDLPEYTARQIMKKARLPRLGKVLFA